MRPVDQTSKVLRALAKALVDNKTLTTEHERERLTVAVFKSLMTRPAPANGHDNERKISERTDQTR